MNKIFKAISTIFMGVALSGCTSSLYTRNAVNDFSDMSGVKSVTDIDSLTDNVMLMMNKTNALTGTYTLDTGEQLYEIEFNAITNSKRINWDLYAKAKVDDTNISIYLKNQKLYMIYPNNGANVILKDSMQNVVDEAEVTLENLNAQYNKDKLEQYLTGDKLEGFDFNNMKEKGSYVLNDGIYTISLEHNNLFWEYDIDASTYLIVETRCSADTFDSVLKFNFPRELTITYPMGLDFLTMNIEDVKEVLKIDSFSELLQPDVDIVE